MGNGSAASVYGCREVVVVCGYGCLLTREVREYLNQVEAYLHAHPEAMYVIFSGGFTNQRSAPDLSEASVMARYLRDQGVDSVAFFLEDASVTTLENMRYSADIVSRHIGPTTHASLRVVVFCDKIRRFKAGYFARKAFCGLPVRVASHDFRRTTKERLRQYFLATPVEILASHFGWLERRGREARLALNRTR